MTTKQHTPQKAGKGKPPIPNPAWSMWQTPSPMATRLLYILTDKADAAGTRTVEAYQTELAAELGTTKRRVQACIKQLVEREYILVQQQSFKHVGSGPNKYTILNPDRTRHQKTKLAAEISGIPLDQMVEYVYWLYYHRDKLKDELYPTVGFIANLAHCPAAKAEAFVRGIAGAKIMKSDRELDF